MYNYNEYNLLINSDINKKIIQKDYAKIIKNILNSINSNIINNNYSNTTNNNFDSLIYYPENNIYNENGIFDLSLISNNNEN